MNPRPAELVSQAHCTAAPTALALGATEAGLQFAINTELSGNNIYRVHTSM